MSEFVELVTGKGKTAHVGPEDDSALRRSIIGDGDYVFQSDDLDAVMVDANHIEVPAMDLMLRGRHARIKQRIQVVVDSGTQAQKRIDTTCIRLTRDDEGFEDADLVTIKGTPVSDNPVAPVIEDTDFDSANQRTIPLFDIPLDEVNVGTPTQRFTQIGPLKAVWDSVTQTTYVLTPSDSDWNLGPMYGYPKLQIVRTGNQCHLFGSVSRPKSGIVNGYVACVIPEELKPRTRIGCTIVHGSGSNEWSLGDAAGSKLTSLTANADASTAGAWYLLDAVWTI